MMSLGVPAGAKIENQIGTSAPVMPSSVSVGTSGKSGWRTWALMLSRISLPALACGSDTGSFIMCTVPGSTSLSVSAPPR